MNILLKEITVRELTEGYTDNEEGGVRGYSGRLDIRPPYQREFVYAEKQRNAVIDTVMKGFPLNVMYWATREDGTFEVIDGQQRTISLCQYVNGDFSFDFRAFHNLQNDEQDQILDYKLMVYVCTGTDSERLQWFRTINIAGEKLTDQELRNAVYSGSWLSDAKRYFSKSGCAAYGLAGRYLSGSPIRQDYLETAIRWISHGNIEVYMSKHQHDPNANELWLYFQRAIEWVKVTFPKYRKEMKTVAWGDLFNKYSGKTFDTAVLEGEVSRLMMDSDVKKKSGIYSYIFDGDERHLDIRAFDDNTKREVYERQGGHCANPDCPRRDEVLDISEMEADHITPWKEGGRTVAENCQMLCRDCNRRKGVDRHSGYYAMYKSRA